MKSKAEAKMESSGPELLRYYSPKYACLASIRATGEIWTKSLYKDWMSTKRIKSVKGATQEEHNEIVRKNIETLKERLQPWQIDAKLPSLSSVKKWITGDVGVKSPTGYTVDPDGVGPDGVPSWLILLRMI